jgi:hypothetical protein
MRVKSNNPLGNRVKPAKKLKAKTKIQKIDLNINKLFKLK